MDDTAQIAKDLNRRDTKHLVAILTDKPIPFSIMFGLPATSMRFAIDFNGQAQRAAIEIDDIGTNPVSLAKLYAQLLPSELLPE